jgi:hypothetical protein
MSTNYDKSIAGSSHGLLWDFYEKYPQLDNDELPEIENPDTKRIIHAIMVGADILRATLIEELGSVRKAIQDVSK